uniref:Uncharacterized protein n=1 Tax=viral metagenome TaxID=1070528 RepID=A0A6C0CZB3_9ZZZZ
MSKVIPNHKHHFLSFGLLFLLFLFFFLALFMTIFPTKKCTRVEEDYRTPCAGAASGTESEQRIDQSRFEPLTHRYVDVNTNSSSPIQNVYNKSSDYMPYDKTGVYNGSFEQQQFINPPTVTKVFEKINDFPALEHCNEEHWYTLGYLAPSSGDPFIETIQDNPKYYWYGPNLGETPISKFPSPYVGGCRPGWGHP